MGRHSITRVAQRIAQAWIVLAAASLLLSPAQRLGSWLPLHLALAGAAATAIAGAAPDFTAAISAGRLPSWAAAPVAMISMGTAAIAIGVPHGLAPVVAIGGMSFGCGGLALAAAIVSAWRSGVNRRHRPIPATYLIAALYVVAGAAVGVAMGTGWVHTATAYMDLRRAHVMLNVAGYLNLSIMATSTLLVPTALRVRAPTWAPAPGLGLCAGGIAVAAAGAAVGLRSASEIGLAAYAVGAVLVLGRAVRASMPWPRHAERAASLHLLASLAWLAIGALGWVASALAGSDDEAFPIIIAVFLVGTVVQALVGAWLHLIPMSAPGGPEAHRRLLARADRGAGAGVATFNAGVVLVVVGSVIPTGWLGGVLIAITTLAAVVKTIRPRSLGPRTSGGGPPAP